MTDRAPRSDPVPPTPGMGAVIVDEGRTILGPATRRPGRAAAMRRAAAALDEAAADPRDADRETVDGWLRITPDGHLAVSLHEAAGRRDMTLVHHARDPSGPAGARPTTLRARFAGSTNDAAADDAAFPDPTALRTTAALLRAAADVLSGVPPMSAEDWWAGSHALSTQALDASPDALRVRTDPHADGPIHDHRPATPTAHARLLWNDGNAHREVEPPVAPAAMSLRIESDGEATFRPLWSPSLTRDGPDPMTALRAVATLLAALPPRDGDAPPGTGR